MSLAPADELEWDDQVVEWRNANAITLSQFNSLIASVEFSFPRFHSK